jgi:hypothetical protein
MNVCLDRDMDAYRSERCPIYYHKHPYRDQVRYR